MPALDDFANQKLAELEAASLKRTPIVVTPLQGMWVEKSSKKLLNFCSNDYLGLAQDVRLRQAAAQAVQELGAGAGASRHVTGLHPIYTKLEAQIAAMKQAQAALVFGSGYLTNLGVIPALVENGDIILMDKLCHACLYDGARLSGATLARFPHNDLDALEKLLKKYATIPRKLILTETVFSMDGDLAPIAEMLALAEAHGAWLLTDDAHGFGLLHPTARAHIQVGTLSKAVGSYGGYVAASQPVIDLITSRARSLIFTTALPPALVAGALASLEIIASEPWRGEKALAYARQFAAGVGLAEPESAIIPLILGSAEDALKASSALEEQGFLVQAIRPPTVPLNSSRLRFTFSAAHEVRDVERLVEVMRRLV